MKDYLRHSSAQFGLFAADTDPSKWIFLRNLQENTFNQIDRSEFEAEIGVAPLPQLTKISLILQGDITQANVDAIVNSTNPRFTVFSGLDAEIFRAGGDVVTEECQRILTQQGPLPRGHAVITTGGNLRAQHVIHTVGPEWQGGNANEPEQLANCYKNSLQLAMKNEMQSIAFSAISTGYYGYPHNAAASVAVTNTVDFIEQATRHGGAVPSLIQFFLPNEKSYICYVEQLSQHGLNLSSDPLIR